MRALVYKASLLTLCIAGEHLVPRTFFHSPKPAPALSLRERHVLKTPQPYETRGFQTQHQSALVLCDRVRVRCSNSVPRPVNTPAVQVSRLKAISNVSSIVFKRLSCNVHGCTLLHEKGTHPLCSNPRVWVGPNRPVAHYFNRWCTRQLRRPLILLCIVNIKSSTFPWYFSV